MADSGPAGMQAERNIVIRGRPRQANSCEILTIDIRKFLECPHLTDSWNQLVSGKNLIHDTGYAYVTIGKGNYLFDERREVNRFPFSSSSPITVMIARK